MSDTGWLEEGIKLAECTGCPLNGSKWVPTFLTNIDRVDVVVVGQSPGRNEVATGRPFVGDSGNLINPVIEQYSTFIAYINTISCRPFDKIKQIDRVPASAEVKSCRGRLDYELKYTIENFNPKLILVFGAVAKKEINRLMKDERFATINAHFVDHPAHILRNRHLEPKFITQLHNILKSTFGKASMDEITKGFVTYDDSMQDIFLTEVDNSRNLGADIETNGKDLFDPEFIVGTMAISTDEHTYFFDGRERDIREYGALMQVLKNPRVSKIFADILYDVVAWHEYGIEINNITDLFPLAFLYDNTFQEYGLDDITMRYFPELASYKSRFHSMLIDNNYLGVETSELVTYNCLDAYVTKLAYNFLYDKLNEKSKMVFNKITVRMLPALVTMKTSGLRVDVQLLDEYHKIFSDGYTELARMFQNRHGIENINSPIQVSKWLFKDLKLAPIKYTKNKNKKTPSTDKDVIEAYAAKYPDVRKLYEARRLANLLSYFLPSIKEHLDPEDIIHPKLKHYGIQSFRLSCSAPNLHGIPRDKTKIEILDKYPLRRLFVARHPDSFIVEFDYSQQEVRIVAELANDVNLLAAFARGDDPHRFVASLVFHKPQDQITEFERQVAKGCVFGAIFGVSARELAIRLRIKESDAQLYLDEFFRLFPSIKKYIERQHDIMLRNGLIVSILGQPRRFVIHQNNINECKREAANHTIQSPAAGITFLSLINVHDKLIQDGVLSKTVYLCNSIHDSLLTDVRRESLEYAVKEIPAIMSSIPKKLGFKVDFPVEAKIGRRWGENIKLEEALKN